MVVHKDPRTSISPGPIRYPDFREKEFYEVHAEACNLAMSRPTPSSVFAVVGAMLHTSPCKEESQVDQQEQSRWQPTRRQLLWAGATVGLLTIAILIGYRYHITLWDWIKLLIVPAVNAGGGIWQQRLISIESGPIVALKWANLQEADLGEVVMEGADLHETNLQRAYLYAAKLQGARLGKVKLSGADLTKANLSGVDRGRNHRGAISHL